MSFGYPLPTQPFSRFFLFILLLSSLSRELVAKQYEQIQWRNVNPMAHSQLSLQDDISTHFGPTYSGGDAAMEVPAPAVLTKDNAGNRVVR